MDLTLHRVDLHQTGGSLANKSCVVFPPGKKGTQKIGLGDETGLFTVLASRKGEPEVVSTTQLKSDRAISRLAPCQSANPSKAENVAVAQGSTVKLFNRKGKETGSFETHASDTVKALCYHEDNIWLGTRHHLNMYRSGTKISSYIPPDSVNDMIAIKWSSKVCICAAMGDRTLRIIDGDKEVASLGLDDSATALALFADPAAKKQPVVFGTTRGHIGCAAMLSNGEFSLFWTAPPSDPNDGGVTAMVCRDVSGNGELEIVVGRSSGLVEVWRSGRGSQQSPVKIFQSSIRQAVTSVDAGKLSSPLRCDIIATTFTGKVVSFMHPIPQEESEALSDPVAMLNLQKKTVKATEMDVSRLREKLRKETEKFQKQNSERMIASTPDISVNTSFVLSADEGTHTLVFESSHPIDLVIIRADIDIDMADITQNETVMCKIPDPGNGNKLLVTYRCPLSAHRLEIKMRTLEGESGVLDGLVIPRVSFKTCLQNTFQIKPLSLHLRSHHIDSTRPLNALTVTGNFSLAELHAWTTQCLDELPEAPPSEQGSFFYRNVFLDTVLIFNYKKNEAKFESDNLSTLSVIREAISSAANNRGRSLSIQTKIDPLSTQSVIERLHPLIAHHLHLQHANQITDALEEIKLQEGDISFFNKALVDIDENAAEISKELKMFPRRFEFLIRTAANLYSDSLKFQGGVLKYSKEEIESFIRNNYSLEQFQEMFHV